MAAGATPTKNDPKSLAQGQLAGAAASLYSAPAERGVRLLSILLVNDTTTNVTATIYIDPDGSTRDDTTILCKDITIPADGVAVFVPGSDKVMLNASGDIGGDASAANQVTYHISGIEMDS